MNSTKKQISFEICFFFLEQITGIGPASQAWEARILPLNYICICYAFDFTTNIIKSIAFYFVYLLFHFFPSTILATIIDDTSSPTTFNTVAGASIIVAIIVRIGKAATG